MFKRLALIAVCVVWGFSAVASAADNPPSFPSNYKDLVAEQIKQSFTDPYSLRDVQIAIPQWDGPVPGFRDLSPAWLVCFSANSRNAQGGYDGIRQYIYYIRDGRLIWYSQAWYTIGEVSVNLGRGSAALVESWEAQGWTWDDILWGFDAMLVTTFVHAYCRDAQWKPWPEMEGR